MDDADLRRSRSLAAALEPVIGQVFFSPECHAAYARARLRAEPGPPRASSRCPTARPTSRAAARCSARCGPGVVAAAFGVFKPEVVSAGVRSAGRSPTRRRSSPRAAPVRSRSSSGCSARPTTVSAARRRCSSARSSRSASRAAPLFAGLRSWWDDPTDPWTRLFHLGDMLRECRGDAHIAAWTSAALDASRSVSSTTSTWGCRCAATCARAAGTTTSSTRARSGSARRGWLDGDDAQRRRPRRARGDRARDRPCRWRRRSTRSATISTSWSGCCKPWGAAIARPAATSAARRSLARPRRLSVRWLRAPAARIASRCRSCAAAIPTSPRRTTRPSSSPATPTSRGARRACSAWRARTTIARCSRCAAGSRSRWSATASRDAFTATISPFFLGDSSLVFRRGAGPARAHGRVRRVEDRGDARPRARGAARRRRSASCT